MIHHDLSCLMIDDDDVHYKNYSPFKWYESAK
jgi:hypothetical protein